MANMNTLKKILVVAVKSEVPVCIVGPHGVGKTSGVYQAWAEERVRRNQPVPKRVDVHNARELVNFSHPASDEYGLWAFGAQNVSIEEIIGYPVVSHSPEAMKASLNYLRSSSFIPPSDHKGGGILVCDELNMGSEDIGRAMMSIMLEGRFLDYVLPPGISIITSMNPAAGKYKVIDLDPPTLDRFCVIPLVVEHREVLSHFDAIGINDDIINFLVQHEEAVNQHQVEVMKKVNQKIATSRGFEYVHKLMANMTEAEKGSAVGLEIFRGCVGDVSGTSFWSYITNPDNGKDQVIDGEQVLSDYGVSASEEGIKRGYDSYSIGKKVSDVRARTLRANRTGRIRIDLINRAIEEVIKLLEKDSNMIKQRIGGKFETMSVPERINAANGAAKVEEKARWANALMFFIDCPADLVQSTVLMGDKIKADVVATTLAAIVQNQRSQMLRDYMDHSDGKRQTNRFGVNTDGLQKAEITPVLAAETGAEEEEAAA